MKSYINQYKWSFLLSWTVSYLVYPTWALPVSVAGRFLIYSALSVYLAISWFLVSKWVNVITVDRFFIVSPRNLSKDIKDHKWVLIISFIAFVFHIPRMTMPILNLGDEALHIQGGLWVYDYLGRGWYRSLQIIFWVVTVLLLAGIKRDVRIFYSKILTASYRRMHTRGLVITLLIFGMIYFLLAKDITYNLPLVRYPPVSRFLYLFSFLISGMTHLAPRMIQLAFYLMTGFYIYRTVGLFYDKETSLLAIPFYLFSPVAFHYSGLAQLTSGVVFFVVFISFHFMRYLINKDKRDLLIVSFFTGLGFLYKEEILLMFFICCSYLVLDSLIEKRMMDIKDELKVMLISLVPVPPWMLIQRFVNWRQYSIYGHHLTSLDTLTIYLKLILTQISYPLFILFVVSIFFVLIYKRDRLSLFYGFLFVAYYLFYTADYTAVWRQHRFSIIFYPVIAVYMALLLDDVIKKIRWKPLLKMVLILITVYLLILSLDNRWGNQVFADKTLRFPNEEAMRWVRDNVKEGEKILVLRIMPAQFYRDKYDIDRDKIIHFWYEMDDVSTPEKLLTYITDNKIKYIMFPYSPEYPESQNFKIFGYLKENFKNEFLEVARFNIENNYIYVYAVKE